MTNADQTEGEATPAISRRARVAAGVAGLAAVLGVGAYAVTDHLANKPEAKVADQAPLPAATSTASASAPATASASAKPQNSTAPMLVHIPKELEKRINDARNANKRLGTEPRHEGPTSAAIDSTKVKVVQTGSNKEGHTMKVASAPLDLTGYRELAWVRDGKPYGDAECTQKITVSPDVPPKVKPTLLICWRTSATKSAYTVAVDFKGHPSATESVAQIAKAWAAMP